MPYHTTTSISTVTPTPSEVVTTLPETVDIAPPETVISPVISPLSQDIVSQEGLVSTLLTGTTTATSTDNIFTIEFTAEPGYYYSKAPAPALNFVGKENYKITVDNIIKDYNYRVISKIFTVKYLGNEQNVFDFDGHNIQFTHETKLIPVVNTTTTTNKITALDIDTSDINSNGKTIPINVSGSPGASFTLTIRDKNDKSIVPPSNTINKSAKLAVTYSQRIDLYDVRYLKTGMDISGNGIGDGVTISFVGDCETPYINISKPQTIDVDTELSFSDSSILDNAIIPESGVYSFNQSFPPLKKYKKLLKTAASSTTTLLLDDTTNLEVGMRVTGGFTVKGLNPTISSIDSNTQITINEAQTISDETTLTFTHVDNQYNINITPGPYIEFSSDIPITIPNYYIKQYINPIIAFVPSATSANLANVTVAGEVTYSKIIGFSPKVTPQGSFTDGEKRDQGLISISMTATSTGGAIVIDRQPRFSETDSTSSDFPNLVTLTKSIRTYSGSSTPLVVLEDTTGLTVGMRVTGGKIERPPVYSSPCGSKGLKYEEVTIKSVETDNVITLSSPQTLPCDGDLTFDNDGTKIFIKSLKAVLSDYDPGDAGVINGVCTITGTAIVSKVGKRDFQSIINFDDFLSKA